MKAVSTTYSCSTQLITSRSIRTKGGRMPHPALPQVTAAYKNVTTAHSLLFEARSLLEEALEVVPESEQATLEQTRQALAQVRQVLDTTLPLAEMLRQTYRLVQEE